MITIGGTFDSLFFSITCAVIIWLCYENNWCTRLLDNGLWSFLGKHITELFVAHIILEYVFVIHNRILTTGYFSFIVLLFFSILLSIVLRKVITEPFARILEGFLLKGKRIHKGDYE